jgi:hypothetical protein
MDLGAENRKFDGSKKKRTTSGEKSSGSSPSLIISPNLDALLEYEERIRSYTTQLQSASPTKDSPLSSPHIPDTPAGLPPPPRKRQKPRSPTSSQNDSLVPMDTVTASLPTTPVVAEPLASNPYINSPPSFDKKLQTEVEELSPVYVGKTSFGTLAMDTAARGSRDSSPGDGRKRRRAHQRSRSSGDEKRPKSQPSNYSQPSSPIDNCPPKQRVDRFFNIKNTFGLFSDNPLQKTELNDVSNALLASRSRHSPQPPPKLGDRSRIKSKLFKLKDPSNGMFFGLVPSEWLIRDHIQVTLITTCQKSTRTPYSTFETKTQI